MKGIALAKLFYGKGIHVFIRRMNAFFVLNVVILSLIMGIAKGEDAMPLKVGDSAPSFQLKDETGKMRTLAEFRGKKVVLYFYPKDNTPGCTKEACSLRDGYSILQEAG